MQAPPNAEGVTQPWQTFGHTDHSRYAYVRHLRVASRARNGWQKNATLAQTRTTLSSPTGSEPTSEESEPFGKSILLAWKHIRAWFLL